MSEAPAFPVPMPDDLPSDSEIVSASHRRQAYNAVIGFVHRRALDFMGADVVPNRKERLITYSALGLLALGTKYVEFKHGAFTAHSPEPEKTLWRSGSHGLVGAVGAGLVGRRSRLHSRLGTALAVLGFDYAVEAGQAVVVTAGIDGGNLHDTLGFTMPAQWEWENTRDLAVAEVAGLLAYQRATYLESRQEPEPEEELPLAA